MKNLLLITTLLASASVFADMKEVCGELVSDNYAKAVNRSHKALHYGDNVPLNTAMFFVNRLKDAEYVTFSTLENTLEQRCSYVNQLSSEVNEALNQFENEFTTIDRIQALTSSNKS